MIIRPTEFGMIQQQNTVSQIRHGEDAKPMIEQQTIVVQSQRMLMSGLRRLIIRMMPITDRKSLMPRIKAIMNTSQGIRMIKIKSPMEKLL